MCALLYSFNPSIMKQLFFIISFFLFALTSVAQQRFIDHLTAKGGKGTVTVNQDQRLTDFVNGDYYDPSEKEIVEVTKVVQKQKVRGYRIQVYWGGNQQSEKGKAQMAGYKVTALFPEYEAYTSFESPHWRCRVGDFATQHEAEEALKKIKKAKVANDPIVVKSEIYMFK